MDQLIYGFILAVVIAFLAYRARSLNRSGAMAAAFVGTVIFGLSGLEWAVLLLAFFITSSALTRAFGRQKISINEKFSKGGHRDAGQVLGNGGVATLFAALHVVYPEASWPWLAFAAALAAVNADTWATELGVLNPGPPRLITNLNKQVEKGTSGGISIVGTLAALAGAALIGLLAALFGHEQDFLFTLGVVTLAGVAGSLFDSVLGATVQAIYHCPTCSKETERHPQHLCGRETVQVRGWVWLNNDLVNFACGAFAAALVFLVV